MKKSVWGAICLAAAMSACTPQQPKSYTISGETGDSLMNGQTIYILSYNTQENVDSTVIEGGKFVFEGVADTAELCRISLSRQKFVNLVLENGNAVIDFETRTVTGTPLNKELAESNATSDSLNIAFRSAIEQLNTEFSAEELPMKRDSAMKVFRAAMLEHNKQTVTAHKNDPVGHLAMFSLVQQMEKEELLALIPTLGEWLQSRNVVSDFVASYEAEQRTAEGQPFTDIKGIDAAGNAVALSDYVGKGNYVLVDLWASWCGPCRAENPNLRKLHETFGDKGLTVLGINVWDTEDKFKHSIEEENITWAQMFNGDNEATKAYGVKGIPHIMLIAPDGTIEKRGLRGTAMIQLITDKLTQ